MKKVRVGIIGIGKMGSLHAMRFKLNTIKGAELTAVCDIDSKRQEWAKKNLPKAKVFADYHDLIDSKLVDAVVIATPHYLHPVIATVSLRKGLHTLIEKPAGVFTSSIRELNEIAKEKSSLTFGIMYNQRTDKLYREAKKIIDDGRLGEIKRINWIITDWYRPQAYYDQGGWRGTWAGEGGGVLINQCPHQLDLFQWLGGMPTKVIGYAKVGVKRDINVENDVTAYFEYPNGASGVFITSTHDFPGTNRLEISGDKGKIVIEKNKMEFTELEIGETAFNATNTKFMPRIPSKKIIKKTNIFERLAGLAVGQHAKILKNFVANILSNEPLIAPGIEGINGLIISNAIHLSSWLNEAVVLPLDEQLFEKELKKRKEEEKEYNKKKVL